MSETNPYRYWRRRALAALIMLAVAGLFAVGIQRLHFEADILSSLPQGDPVLADARYIFTHHPIYDRVVVDLGHPAGKLDRLDEAAQFVEARMQESGLFREVGLQSMGRLLPELIFQISGRLPVLFSAAELKNRIEPLLTEENIHRALNENLSSLQDLGGIGQMRLISEDPLAMRNHVLARMASLVPSKGARIHNGRPLSADGKHVLIVAEPASPGTDTRYAAAIEKVMTETAEAVKARFGTEIAMTPAGGYRAALDNETSMKANVKKAVLFSTIGIALLLMIGFPRPLIGLMALLPAFAGTALAFFVFSLFRSSISLMSVGFGGAIVSFTVDYGLTYLLFLDRPHETRGFDATKEVWSLGLLAMLTTACSFAFLGLTGFSILLEIGLFSALGVVFTYIFVHTVFPLVFPVIPAAKRASRVPLMPLIDKIASPGLWKLFTAAGLGVFMLFFAWPEFRVDLTAMNTVSAETQRADRLFQSVWGNVFNKVYLLIEGRTPRDFQDKCDRISDLLQEETSAGRINPAFVPSMIFPGEEAVRRNSEAWQAFWTPERIGELRKNLQTESRLLGFSQDAFAPFLKLLADRQSRSDEFPEKYAALLGIKKNTDGTGWMQVVSLTPGPAYRGDDFYARFSATGLTRIFDPNLFSQRLGALLQSTFLKMAAIVGLVTLLTIFLYFLDWRLTLLGMAPTLFAIVCTLGTLNLIGEPLGIPILMVSVVVIGMGTDYGLYLIRAHQRYIQADHPSLGLIRLSVFLSFATTFLGFLVISFSDNAVLKSAGLGLALGIGYSFLGAVMIMPPVLKRIFDTAHARSQPGPARETVRPGSKRHFRRTLKRFRNMEPYSRFFARFKIILDPMFPRLAHFVKDPKVIIDVGCGYGVPAAWLLELFPQARIYGIEPNPSRVLTASRAVGGDGVITLGAAPDLPEVPEKADTALMLDMSHFLTDEAFRLTLTRLRARLRDDAVLVMRSPVSDEFPEREDVRWRWWIEVARSRAQRKTVRLRTGEEIQTLLTESGFTVTGRERSAPGREELWVIAEIAPNADRLAIGGPL